jgi:hypothetical protein
MTAQLKHDEKVINELLGTLNHIEYAMDHPGAAGLYGAISSAQTLMARAPTEAVARMAAVIAEQIERLHPITDPRTAYLFRGMLWRVRLALEDSRKSEPGAPLVPPTLH